MGLGHRGFRFCPVQKEDESSLPKGATGPQGYTQCLDTGVSREETLYNARKRKHPLPKLRFVCGPECNGSKFCWSPTMSPSLSGVKSWNDSRTPLLELWGYQHSAHETKGEQ